MSNLSSLSRKKVKSSHLESVGYDAFTQTLVVEFKSGNIFAYCPVPILQYEEIINASSVGSTFHKLIRVPANQGVILAQKLK